MSYLTLANSIAVIHFITLAAVVIGLLACFRYKRFRPLEAGALLLIVVFWSVYGNCPLTILEEKFRVLAGKPSGITNIGFLPYYADKLLGISITSKIVQRSTFFTGGAIFTASLEWLSPYLHFHLFSIRRTVKRMLGLKTRRRYA